jgi:hypothetical protein
MGKNIQVKQSINKIIYGALVELMLESYGNTNMLTTYRHTLKIKHHNLLNDWRRESMETFKFLESPGNEDVIKQYHQVVNVIERITKLDDLQKFTDILNMIDEYLKGKITIIED